VLEAVMQAKLRSASLSRRGVAILDECKELLDEENVTIPSSDREGRGLYAVNRRRMRVSA
jgi:hypothetical protein